MLPVADLVDGDIYRIYFSGRNINNQSLIGYVEININEPQKILNISEKPVLNLGKLGTFDGNGVSPTCIVNRKGYKLLYYMGWNAGLNVRASEVSGLAVSQDGKSFTKYSQAPILQRTNKEPYLIAVISCVLMEGKLWRMWYDSCDEWVNKDLPRYNIKYAESRDGVHWTRHGVVSVDYKSPEESRISRACVLKDYDRYKMWYCYAMNNDGYRMGYAESVDGIKFHRMDDEVGIDISESGWDSEMICYPFVFDHKGERFMLYCGNGYGRAGFGLARLGR
jgi:predicted GH43/DUF377 family glycosyl hydrolase